MTSESATTAITVAGTGAVTTTLLKPEAIAWFVQERGISQRTLERLPVASGMATFRDAEFRRLPAIIFRYPHGWKARSYPEKFFTASQEKKHGVKFELDFWNIEAVLASNSDTVWITEGELDAIALVEAGISADAVLSVPNGAKELNREDEDFDPRDVRGYQYVMESLKAGLNRVKKFVWCGDGDGVGLGLRQDMAKILGAARFWFVDWPEGAKDANAFLRSDGANALHELVTDGALPWPVDGLFRMSELPNPPPLTLWDPGFPEWEGRIKLAAGTMSVVTGWPGSGKTVLFNEIWYRIAKKYDIVLAIASFETGPKPHIRRQLRTLYSGRLENEMTFDETKRADAWIDAHYIFLQHPTSEPTLEWYLDMMEVAVIRYGAQAGMLDPWNRMEGQHDPKENKTDYIGRCLRTTHSFAKDFGIHQQIIAHPSKVNSDRRGLPPGLDDISDSSHWYNMVDQGFVVHRPKRFDGKRRCTEAELYHRKARFMELGFECRLGLNYNLSTCSYEAIPGE